MSTTRPYAADDRGSDSGEGGSGASAPEAGQRQTVDRQEQEQGRRQGRDVGAGQNPAEDEGPEPEPIRKLSLTGESGIVPRARDFTRQALRDWGWLPAASADRRAAAEDVLLVVSELVTNACLHAGGPDELRLRRNPKSLRLEVVDSGPGEPSPRTPHRPGRPGGHGMFIVQRLCLDWGVVRETDRPGKTVWAELAAPA
jgi:anti-sigma regulatory factor (Ser/Thr protein kinase)